MNAVSCDGKMSPMPYIRICSTDEDEIQQIINAFRDAGIRVDIEWLIMDGFISADEMT